MIINSKTTHLDASWTLMAFTVNAEHKMQQRIQLTVLVVEPGDLNAHLCIQ